MGSGIVSIALALDRQWTLSRVAFAVTIASWAALVVLIGLTLARDRRSLMPQMGSPASLTWVAASAVLGSRLALGGRRDDAGVLLALAFVTSLVLIVALLRAWLPCGARESDRLPRNGTSFMLVVAPQSLAVLGATLAGDWGEQWLLYAALVCASIAIALYPYTASKFHLRELLIGGGEHWIAGGALAISALSFAELAIAAERVRTSGVPISVLEAIAVVVWIIAIVWLPILLITEIAKPRLGFTVRRWSTVFPVGMYAACSFEVASTSHAALLHDFARVWTWPAFVLWLLVLAATIRTYGSSLAREHR